MLFVNEPEARWLALAIARQPTWVRSPWGSFSGVAQTPAPVEWGWGKSPAKENAIHNRNFK
jgi:hypothetical protein